MNGETVERENVIDDPANAEIVKHLSAVIQSKWNAFA
jgi:hypothetical protein